jgi:hypothetical protein
MSKMSITEEKPSLATHTSNTNAFTNRTNHASTLRSLWTIENIRQHKKNILAMIDACTKYVKLVVLLSKEASVVIDAIFKYWICRYSCPITIHIEKKEFVNQLSAGLCKSWQYHRIHPTVQCTN